MNYASWLIIHTKIFTSHVRSTKFNFEKLVSLSELVRQAGISKIDLDIDTEITGMTTTSNHKVHTGAADERVLDEGKLQPP